MNVAVDPRTGILLPQARIGISRARPKGKGFITYRCHTCGDLIPRKWEVFYVDPEREGWASYMVPEKVYRTMTTHHDWHMQATQ